MGDRGRLVVPAEARARLHLSAGDPLLLIETEGGLVMATRDQVQRSVKAALAGDSLLDDLLAERRRAAATDDEG